MALVDPSWMPNCAMKRVICHWTVGNYKASDFDREHYHILIEDDGALVRGKRSIEDNVSVRDGRYAAHTLNCNTGSIGISVCCMRGARERLFHPGDRPMTEKQWHTMAQVSAELCQFYRIPITPRTVLGHGEVQVNLGIRQNGKWDPMVLPWEPNLSRTEVGTMFRSLVQNCIECGPEPEEELIRVTALVRGEEFPDAVLTNGSSYLKIRPIAEKLGWGLPRVGSDDLDLVVDGQKHTLAFRRIGASGYVSTRALAEALGVAPSWDPSKRRVLVP